MADEKLHPEVAAMVRAMAVNYLAKRDDLIDLAHLAAEKAREEILPHLGGIAVDNVPCGDNLAIVLCSYFEDHLDCPDEEPDENGWKPWAAKKADEALELIAAAIRRGKP